MTIVAIHQPNYAPWLGYFYKINKADTFVFLDDVQFSKQSYINRVKVLGEKRPRWLTVPVKVSLGQSIHSTLPASLNWPQSHLSSLRNYYRKAPAFKAVWTEIENLYAALPNADIGSINRCFVESVSTMLGLETTFRASSEIEDGASRSDERLVQIVQKIAPGGTYLSGKGGASYQDPSKFQAAGLRLAYTEFEPPVYPQLGDSTVTGLSILDAIFHLGWDETAALLNR